MPILGILASSFPAAGGAFESIASASGTGSSTTITFTSIPSTYKHLQIRFMYYTATAGDNCLMRFNSDTGTNYARHQLHGNGSSATASGAATQSALRADANVTGSLTDRANVAIIDIQDYASTSNYKTVRLFTGVDNNGSGDVCIASGLWMSASAITSISLFTLAFNFTTSTVASLYGIKGA